MKVLLILLLLASPVAAEELNCVQTPTEVICTIEDETLLDDLTPSTKDSWGPKALPAIVMPVVRYMVIKVAESVAVDLVKDAIIKQFKERFPTKPVPTNIALIKAH